ncbi:MAG: hypothetical protein BWX80_02686 [Candidatus Hydrogenedentes bacterium ADurb.Bin101]|nr:MAG: hypothetical protein BWX80_02686 [Candidatus Hydrogenedentes bacterium ADurb.Bin101]
MAEKKWDCSRRPIQTDPTDPLYHRHAYRLVNIKIPGGGNCPAFFDPVRYARKNRDSLRRTPGLPTTPQARARARGSPIFAPTSAAVTRAGGSPIFAPTSAAVTRAGGGPFGAYLHRSRCSRGTAASGWAATMALQSCRCFSGSFRPAQASSSHRAALGDSGTSSSTLRNCAAASSYLPRASSARPR